MCASNCMKEHARRVMPLTLWSWCFVNELQRIYAIMYTADAGATTVLRTLPTSTCCVCKRRYV